MEDIKVIIFDYDDTLVESLQAKWAQHKHVAKTEYGKVLSDEEIRKHWTKPYSQLIMALYNDNDIDRAKTNNKKYEVDFPKVLFPETLSTLERLRTRNILIGIVTSTSESSLVNDLSRFNLAIDFFNYIQAENATMYHKPDIRVFDPFLKWLQAQKIKTSQVLYVGDGLHDLAAAQGVGFNFVGVTTGLVNKDEFKKHGATSINSLSELIR